MSSTKKAREDLAARDAVCAVVHDGHDPPTRLSVGVVLVEPAATPIGDGPGALVGAPPVREGQRAAAMHDARIVGAPWRGHIPGSCQ